VFCQIIHPRKAAYFEGRIAGRWYRRSFCKKDYSFPRIVGLSCELVMQGKFEFRDGTVNAHCLGA
jgi:hypothetical protein